MRRLAEATNAAVETPAVRERFEMLGVSIEPPERRTTAHYRTTLPHEVEKQAAIVKAAGLSAE